MDTLIEVLKKRVTASIEKALAGSLVAEEISADMAPCLQEEFGHYQCNSPLRLSKTLHMPPRVIAQKIVDGLDRSIYEKIDIAGPGFINLTLSPAFLSEQVQAILADPLLGAVKPKRQRVLVEFSSPNVAKELHVGHIRSTIIGDSLARLFEFLGHDVLRINHIGDWGTQFGMLITYMKRAAPDVLSGKTPTDLHALMDWYRAAKKQFDADTEFKKESQLEVVRLQSGEPTALFAWKLICDISRKGFQEIYDLLNIKITERGESFYNPELPKIVQALEQKGLITVSDGAKCLYLEGFKNREGEPLPLMVQKSDGGYNYDTTDLAAIYHRIYQDRADRIIYVTDNGQALHFQMVFAAAEKAGWLDPKKTQVDHVGFGLVLGADGKKFKTRSGDTEKLIDLILGAVEQARILLQERLPEAAPQEVERLAHVLGIGAIKYADLSCHRTKDYTFSYDRMLKFEGNTAVFLLYAYVRINGIKRKTHADIEEILAHHKVALKHSSEIALGLHLRRFGEVLELMARDLLPNRLTDYLYALAEKFNAFFRDCRVEGVPEEKSRLVLCEITARILKKGLDILGLQTVERM
ncbi:MAG: arginine--tRNA ligase [Chlamydiia bacterium]|nr:arginine--tRNA ligase [Chlamydiia bacterium]